MEAKTVKKKVAPKKKVVAPKVVDPKVEYWVRQIRIDGETITGKVKPEDKKRFLELCKANGADVDERDWFKKVNWQDRVFKKSKVLPKK